MELEKPVENVSESCQDVCLRAALDDLISPTFQRARGVPGQLEPAGRRPRLGKRAMDGGSGSAQAERGALTGLHGWRLKIGMERVGLEGIWKALRCVFSSRSSETA